MAEVVIKIIIGIFVVGGIVWSFWYENISGRDEEDEKDKSL